ncbi:MAG: hypothetical protein IT582_07695 [Opitutaceae bacterium]|nr:hypothetical protein [Opitutaceae bacterium]
MKSLRLFLPLLLLAGVVTDAHAADRAAVQAILITASNEPGQTDPRLARYEPTLRRILRFESYRFVGQGSAALAVPGDGVINLGQGQRLEISAAEPARGLRLRVAWKQDGQTLIETGLSLRPGAPAVLGGPATGQGEEVYAIILTGG